MKATHVLKHNNIAKATWISICTFTRLFVTGFIQQNAFVFENLLRVGSPFGGNVLPANR
jgi:hypothetical protein